MGDNLDYTLSAITISSILIDKRKVAEKTAYKDFDRLPRRRKSSSVLYCILRNNKTSQKQHHVHSPEEAQCTILNSTGYLSYE